MGRRTSVYGGGVLNVCLVGWWRGIRQYEYLGTREDERQNTKLLFVISEIKSCGCKRMFSTHTRAPIKWFVLKRT